jgi:hypothetical protein
VMSLEFKRDVVKRFRQKASIGEIENAARTFLDKKRPGFDPMTMVEDVLFEELRKKVDKAMVNKADHFKVIEEYEDSVTEFNMYQILSYVESNQVMSRIDTKLMKIATEDQSVHLDEIETKTRRNIGILTSFKLPHSIITLDFIFDRWTVRKQVRLNSLPLFIQDVSKWYESSSEYKAALDGALAKILLDKNQDELFVRMLQELWESRNMCLTGRLARICNIFAGFDDDFSTDMPTSQKMQNLFAQLDKSTFKTDKKLKRAKEILQEFKVPEHEWAPWLEALE